MSKIFVNNDLIGYGIKWEGDYDVSGATKYNVGSIIKYGGDTYIANNPSKGKIPTNTDYWDFGGIGDKGEQGFSILTGIVAPTTEGIDGDSYIDTSTGLTYKKASGTWDLDGGDLTAGNTTGNTVGNTVGNTTGNTVGNTTGNTVGNTTGNTLDNDLNNTDGNTTGNTLDNDLNNTDGNTVGNTTGNTVGNTTGNTVGNTIGTVQWKGEWLTGTYQLNDGVSYNGSSYVANTITTNTPPHSDWTIMAEKGADGVGAGDMLATTYDPTNIADDAFARANHTGTQTASTISNFSDAVGAQNILHGIINTGHMVELNTDITKLDILATDYFIAGVKYNYAGGTAVVPTIGAGDTSTWLGLDASGLIYSVDSFTTVQKLTILPLARLQTVVGQSGPGSDLQSPIHLEFTIGMDGYIDAQWLLDVLGALYASGGTFSESSTPLQVDQTSGVFYNAERKKLPIIGSSDISASPVYAIGGTTIPRTEATLVSPKYWDDGTDIVVLGPSKYVSHTLLRSPKEEDNFFLIYGDTEFSSQAGAEQAPIDYSIFTDQASSGLIPVARIIQRGDGTNIASIQDERPSIGATQSAIIGTATMQQVYDNSTSPEILTDAIRGALSVKRGSGADTDDVLEIMNGAGGKVAGITGEGDISGNNFSGSSAGDNTGDQDLSGLMVKSNNLSDLTDDATARGNLDVDQAGTDNSTDVTLAGTPNYITIVGQVITRALINLTSHITGILPIANGGTGDSTDTVIRSIAGTPTGGDRITRVISLTSAEYTSASKSSSTLYIITDA